MDSEPLSSELRIRPGSAADADSVAAVHWRGWETYRGLVPDRLIDTRTLARRRAEWRQELERPSDGLFVAEAGSVVGFVRA
jgi:hypothetical protein